MDYEPSRLRRRRNEHWGVEPDPELEDQLEDVTGAYEVVNRRRILWRDSAFILIGVVVALLLAQILLPRDGGTGSDDPTDFQTGAALGLTFAPRTLAPAETFGPILDPGLGIDATPTPIPVITLGPTRRPTPTPKPGETAEPTPDATAKVTPRPTQTPRPPTPPPPTPAPPTPPPTDPPPPPPPAVSISCSVIAPLTVECTASVSNVQNNSQDWSTDADGTETAGGDTTNSVTYLYTTTGPHTITLTVTGDDGSTTSDSEEVAV